MKFFDVRWSVAAALLTALAIFDPADALAQSIPISEIPLFTKASQPPLNMLVLGRDHKLFNAAYNDASDLNADGNIDVGYKPAITYYGYFDSAKCYTYNTGTGVFDPQSTTASKKCPGKWSGDYLNYVTTSRIDALRKVLYGGFRSTDTVTQTTLERAYIPQDGHAFGKEYQGILHDGYDIHDYTPYAAPSPGRYLLIANETLISAVAASGTLRNPVAPPLMRVMENSPFRIWNWTAIEGPVGGNDCFDSNNVRRDCLTGAGGNTLWSVVPSSAYASLTQSHWSLLPEFTANQSTSETEMNRLFPTNGAPTGTNRILCGTGPASVIDGVGNRFKGLLGCPNNDEDYLTEFAGQIAITVDGNYRFAVDGDDAVEAYIDGVLVASWYGPHGDCAYCSTHSGAAVHLTVGNHSVLFRHQELGGGDNYRLLWLPPGAGIATRDDYTVRVNVCKAGLLEDNCEKYTNSTSGVVTYKPTGLMHDYGETDRMMFGLISGSFMHNHQGGVLRKQVGSFKDEVNLNTGQFVTPKKGLIATLDGIKIQSIESTSDAYKNPNYSYNCSPGWSSNQPDGSCRPWGNPIGEMMFEGLRYFAGASVPEPEYSYANAGSDDNTLGLPQVSVWKDPYKSTANGGLGYLACSKPFQTVISDINPSFDSNLPGSPFGGAPSGPVPSTLTALDVGALGDAMWAHEGYGTKSIYIGQAGSVYDSAPTPKDATSFGNIRGLSPEEPTREGSYTSAEVAFYGHTHPVNPVQNSETMQTFSVALSSPLPRIEFPVNGQSISLVPFAKTVSGVTGASPTGFQPTNQIVGFYITKIANIPGTASDVSVNGGRAYASFRISYEDAEQGNDYDMDAIASYEILANADNSVSVHLKSEYAAGSATQHMGYVISGTDHDGVYLEVVDVADGSSTVPSAQVLYRLNTPPGLLPGACDVATPPAVCSGLPLDNTRVFNTGTGVAAAVLNDPLWFAAKYGGFKDADGDGLPGPAEWDANVTGTPDNYFLVTNAIGLKAQLQKAFDSIIAQSQDVGSAAASGSRFVPSGSLAYQASYLATDWTGDLKAFPLNSDGSLGAVATWDANIKLPLPAARTVFTSKLSTGAFTGTPFTAASLTAAGLNTTLMGSLNTTLYNLGDVVAYLRGDQSKETNQSPAGPYRARTTKIGDILDSTPTVAFREGYGYQNLPVTVNSQASGSATYQAFVTGKALAPVVYVGANDGMLHAFDGSSAATGGTELFSYIPNSVIPKLNRLVQPGYAHTYYVNGTPRLGDVYDGAWKTLLIGATGAGARSVFGLDVTNPSSFAASNVLWEFNDQLDTDMGVSIGIPSLPTITSDGLWVTAFGNGYNSARNRAELFILNAKTGVKLNEIDTGIGGNSVSTACVQATGPDDCPNGLSSAVMIDSDLDGTGDTIYAGDYLGNLWKFTCTPDTIAITATHPVHLCTTPWIVGLNGLPLIKAQDSNGLRQPITSGVYAIHNPLGGSIVYFGTGRYLLVNDANPTSGTLVNSIYSVWDNPNNTGTTLRRADLQQQTITSYSAATGFVGVSSNLFDYEPAFPRTGTASKMGWYLDLVSPSGSDPMTSERVIAAPNGILGSLLVNAFRPTGDLCLPGGENTFFELNLLNGSAAFSVLPGGSAVPPGGTGGSDLGNGPPLGSPNPVISIPGQPGIPTIGCPPGNPTCTPPESYCTPDIPGYPQCAPPPWCQPGSACIRPTGCAPGVPGWPYTGACAVAGQECKWFNPGTPVGNLIACRISWRQLR